MIDPSISAALDAMQESVFLLGKDRRVLFANRIARSIFGGQFINTDFVTVIRHPSCISTINAVIEGDSSGEVIVAVDQPARMTLRILVTAPGDGIPGWADKLIVSISDISNVQQAEQMRSDFIANVSHELRSPLTAISGFTETLKGAAHDDPEARERFLNLLEQETQRMVRLISDLLSLSKVEALQRVRPDGKVNVGEIINRVKSSLSPVAETEGSRISIKIDDDSEIPGSSDELTQVFQNLIENAIKYGKQDSDVRVHIFRQEEFAGMPGPCLQIDVMDEGAGIPREHIGRLTERFYRVDNHRSRDKGGTGLGLAIVKHIVNRHRGRLQISSEPGVGSKFSVVLPWD